MQVYNFIKKILEEEFHIIQMGLVETQDTAAHVDGEEEHSILGGIADADADADGISPETFAIKPVKKASKARRKIIMLGNIEPFHFI